MCKMMKVENRSENTGRIAFFQRANRKRAGRIFKPFFLIVLLLSVRSVLFSQEKTPATVAEPSADQIVLVPPPASRTAAVHGGVTLPVPSAAAPDDTPLCLGNPSRAEHNSSCPENYLMEKKKYTLSYSAVKHEPNWTAWHLSPDDIGGSGRSNKFESDQSLPEGWYCVQKNDYQYTIYGFDRGHMCPSADRTDNPDDNRETFLMTNMVPQAPDCNRIVWKALEDYERDLAEAGNELYIFAGPSGAGGTSAAGTFQSIPLPGRSSSGKVIIGDDGKPEPGDGPIAVPAYTWKIIIVLPCGEDDRARISEKTHIIAVRIPNAQGCGDTGSWQQYVTSVDSIETETGFDFLDLLDDSVEDVLESRTTAE